MSDSQLDKSKRLLFFSIIHNLIMIGIMACGAYLFTFSSVEGYVFSYLFYILIVCLPVILYIKFAFNTRAISYLKLDSLGIKNIGIAIAIGVFVFIIFLAVNGFRFNPDINIKRDLMFVIGTMMVGVFEEISLRGFYLQVLEPRMGFLKANILSSLMFACLHAITLLKSSENMMLSLIMFMVISLWLGYIFEKSKSLWVPIIVHALYNLIVYLT